MPLKLHHIFIPQAGKSLYKKHELFELEVQKYILKKVAKLLNASYQEKVDEEGNLCFINNREIHAAYKTIFTSIDMTHAVLSLLKKDIINIETDKVLLPLNPTKFWESVERGKNIKKK
jgi:hypothetical protein